MIHHIESRYRVLRQRSILQIGIEHHILFQVFQEWGSFADTGHTMMHTHQEPPVLRLGEYHVENFLA